MSRPTTGDAAPTRSPSPTPAVPRSALATTAGSGLLLFALGLADSAPTGPAGGRASADAIRAYVDRNELAMRLGVAVGLLTVVTLVVFVAALAGRIRAASPGSGLAGAVASAGLLVAGIQLLDVAANGMLRLLPGLIGTTLDRVDDATVRGWYGLTGFTHFLGDLQLAFVAVLLAGASAAALRFALLPRWLCWAGAVVAAAAALGTLAICLAARALYPLSFAGMVGFWLWGGAVGLAAAVHWRRERRIVGR